MEIDRIVTLKTGTPVRIRAVRPDDQQRLADAFRNLEAATIYTRFFHQKRGLSEEELKRATEVDFESEVALVATVGEGEGETIIAGARYAVLNPADPRPSAEVAFAVEEDFQGQGIAGRLLEILTEIARAKGVARFEAEVLPENRAMIAVFERSGLSVEQRFDGGALHIVMPLGERPAGRSS